MGVQGLWELLAPVGRRVSVETLAGKRLAVDASIWMVQFVKAMRDDKGDMVRNAHLLGFLRRILKLLFLRARPVFVFDGGTPALKRRTIAARRRQRDAARAKIRKTAEKLLLNHLKSKRLEELAEEIKRGKKEGDAKGKKVVDEGGEKGASVAEQENFDAMLAASLAAEEEEFANDEGPSSAGDAHGGGDDDEDEEMIFPVASGNIDPAILASLPPSMQLDLLVQMRENLMAENRQKYQKIKKTPTKFSELQIQSYLKTVAFRREIDEVQKCATGRGLGGVQTSRIASEANREFIFSSSFTGDKNMLSSTTAESNRVEAPQKPITRVLLKRNLFASESKSSSDASVDKVASDIGHEVETYRDERGRLRVSRVRGCGIRMTRDLQRNLDLMKEYEQELSMRGMHTDPKTKYTKDSDEAKRYPGINSPSIASINEENSRNISGTSGTLTQDGNRCSDHLSDLGSRSSIEISFLENDSGVKDTDDDLFLDLVSGSSTSKLYSERILPDGTTEEFESECVWEEGVLDDITRSQIRDHDKDSHLPFAEINSEDEVEWEEGGSNVPEVVIDCQAELEKVVPLGMLEEEAAIQEAIRRSLQDIEEQKPTNAGLGISTEDRNFVESLQNVKFDESRDITHQPFEKHPERSPMLSATADGHDQLQYPCRKNVLRTSDSPEDHSPPFTICGINLDDKASSRGGTNTKLISFSVTTDSIQRMSQVNGSLLPEEVFECQVTQGDLCTDENTSFGAETMEKSISSSIINDSFGRTQQVNNVGSEGAEDQVTCGVPCMDAFEQTREEPISGKCREENAHTTPNIDLDTVGKPDSDLVDAHVLHSQSSQLSQSLGSSGKVRDSQKTSPLRKMVVNNDLVQEYVPGSGISVPNTEEHPLKGKSQEDDHNLVSDVNLDEEISFLRQERVDLGDERRRLESNAESVSSEMFAECQELLQMFGLPFIIAPMEAEAQCAYMEMMNLVDGVVTDDSDVFLFGSRSVYKNIFDDRKYVETYFMKDIESELGLSRDILIRMALLLGSDYTEGVSGIGIVNAIEVVRAFPEEDGLQKFREWIESPDPAIFGKLGTPARNPKRRSSKSNKKDSDATGENAEASEEATHETQPSTDDIHYIKETFMDKHRNVSKNWHLPSSFPSASVVSAYTTPQVDESTEPFTWGKPDLFLLRKLCWESFGWSNKKSDELLLPVLKEYNKHETQLRLEAFYTFNERFAKIRSQRIKKAVKGITGKRSTVLMDDLVQEGSSSGKKKGSIPSASEECISEGFASKRKRGDSTSGPEECKTESSKVKDTSMSKSSKRPGRQKSGNQKTQTEHGGAEPVVLEGGKNHRSGMSADVRGGGRGRNENVDYEPTESNSRDGCDAQVELGKHIQVPETMSELRRSMRRRKHVVYTEKNIEHEDDGSDAAVVLQEPVDQGSSIRFRDVPGHEEGLNQNPDAFSRDYLVSGGGFCMEENEGGAFHPDASPIRSLSEKESMVREGNSCSLDGDDGQPSLVVEDIHSREYLLSGGGGFCTNGSGTQTYAVHPDQSPTKKDLDPGRITEEINHENSAAIKDAHVLYSENAGEGEANLGLRAMPSLRRKRRKVNS
ncbi:DNA repair protein UVH3 [Iris pallida]|uniref:DNA repair protein UVH3 n=1 Tax=Iris pallida TaxID=29817 RepID=A0AAX6HL65_IRIPA|nr:DNA repair protein UVH3 [Iris pallida]